MSAGPRVLVVGAGGLGGLLAALLDRAGASVGVVARGAHGEAVRNEGLVVVEGDREQRYRMPVWTDLNEAARESHDLVLVTVKTHALDPLARGLVRLGADGSTILPLMNGVDAAERIVAFGVRPDRVVSGAAYLTGFRTAPGRVVRQGAHGRLAVGAPRPEAHAALLNVEGVFRPTELDVEVAPDIHATLWAKLAVVSSLTALCVPGLRTLGAVRALPEGRALQTGAIAEVLAVARGRGIRLPDPTAARTGQTLDRFPEDFVPSVVHDLRHGRASELDDLCGLVVREGARLGVAVPLHASVVARGGVPGG